MKQTSKSIFWILLFTLMMSVLLFPQIEKSEKLWEKLIIIFFVIGMITIQILKVKKEKYFKLINDNLIIHQIFSNQKVYNLQSVSSWTENHYIFFGIKTKNEITINIEGKKIRLFDKNSKDYGKLSDYLNENLSDRYENYR